MALPNNRTAKLLLQHRMKSITPSATSSHFCSDVISIITAVWGRDKARIHEQQPQKFSFTDLKVHMPNRIRTYIAQKLNVTFAASGHKSWQHYKHHPAAEWQMSQYLSDIKDGSTDTSHLAIAQFRTHGHVLGSSIDKVYGRSASHIIHCPCCGRHEPHTATHTIATMRSGGCRIAPRYIYPASDA